MGISDAHVLLSRVRAEIAGKALSEFIGRNVFNRKGERMKPIYFIKIARFESKRKISYRAFYYLRRADGKCKSIGMISLGTEFEYILPALIKCNNENRHPDAYRNAIPVVLDSQDVDALEWFLTTFGLHIGEGGRWSRSFPSRLNDLSHSIQFVTIWNGDYNIEDLYE